MFNHCNTVDWIVLAMPVNKEKCWQPSYYGRSRWWALRELRIERMLPPSGQILQPHPPPTPAMTVHPEETRDGFAGCWSQIAYSDELPANVCHCGKQVILSLRQSRASGLKKNVYPSLNYRINWDEAPGPERSNYFSLNDLSVCPEKHLIISNCSSYHPVNYSLPLWVPGPLS